MTKQEWLDCNDLEIMLKEVNNDRKRQLFALACCRRVEHLIQDQRSKDCLDKIELFIDGKIDEQEFESVRQAADIAYRDKIGDAAWDTRAARAANIAWAVARAANVATNASCVSCAYYVISVIANVANVANVTNVTVWAEERAKQIEFLRDIYNPFPLNIKFSELAISLAEQVYNGDNDARLILSDYLEENKYPEELYLHLKQLNHYKGCWVIDQILEKS